MTIDKSCGNDRWEDEIPKPLDGARKEHIEKALKATSHDLDKAADVLEISVSRLERLMKKLEIRNK